MTRKMQRKTSDSEASSSEEEQQCIIVGHIYERFPNKNMKTAIAHKLFCRFLFYSP